MKYRIAAGSLPARSVVAIAHTALSKAEGALVRVSDVAPSERALELGRPGMTAVDVFEREPLSGDSPLWGMENVLISPHSADHTVDPDWLELTMSFFVENFHRYRSGQALQNVVDKRAGY